MSANSSPKKKDPKLVTNGWLKVIESEPPKFTCPFTQEKLTAPCEQRGCALWSYAPKLYSCAGAFVAAKAANAEDRLLSGSSGKDRYGTLRQAADGKLSFYDLAHFYGLSRQRVEGYVSTGRQMLDVLSPLLVREEVSPDAPKKVRKRIGSPMAFTHTSPTGGRDSTKVCICCESKVPPKDRGMILAILDRSEVAWCSRECADEYPIDAYLISNRYKRHWSSVALALNPVDERSRVREVTPDRMEALRALAVEHGYVGP